MGTCISNKKLEVSPVIIIQRRFPEELIKKQKCELYKIKAQNAPILDLHKNRMYLSRVRTRYTESSEENAGTSLTNSTLILTHSSNC